MTGRSDDGLVRTTLDEIEGSDAVITAAAWPGDTEWAEFVEEGIRDAVPLLEERTGVDWPIEGELTVIETISPYLAGYAGVYYPAGRGRVDAVIEVGDEVDLEVMVHELAHAWFNRSFLSQRWITEGLAVSLASDLVVVLDPDIELPRVWVTPSSPGAVPLAEWGHQTLSATEEYGYAASGYVFDTVGEEIGEEATAQVLSALVEQSNPYRLDVEHPGRGQTRLA